MVMLYTLRDFNTRLFGDISSETDIIQVHGLSTEKSRKSRLGLGHFHSVPILGMKIPVLNVYYESI